MLKKCCCQENTVVHVLLETSTKEHLQVFLAYLWIDFMVLSDWWTTLTDQKKQSFANNCMTEDTFVFDSCGLVFKLQHKGSFSTDAHFYINIFDYSCYNTIEIRKISL